MAKYLFQYVRNYANGDPIAPGFRIVAHEVRSETPKTYVLCIKGDTGMTSDHRVRKGAIPWFGTGQLHDTWQGAFDELQAFLEGKVDLARATLEAASERRARSSDIDAVRKVSDPAYLASIPEGVIAHAHVGEDTGEPA